MGSLVRGRQANRLLAVFGTSSGRQATSTISSAKLSALVEAFADGLVGYEENGERAVDLEGNELSGVDVALRQFIPHEVYALKGFLSSIQDGTALGMEEMLAAAEGVEDNPGGYDPTAGTVKDRLNELLGECLDDVLGCWVPWTMVHKHYVVLRSFDGSPDVPVGVYADWAELIKNMSQTKKVTRDMFFVAQVPYNSVTSSKELSPVILLDEGKWQGSESDEPPRSYEQLVSSIFAS